MKQFLSAEYIYCLYHEPTETLVEALTWTQLRCISGTFDSYSIGRWRIWSSGTDTWLPLGHLIYEILIAPIPFLRSPPAPAVVFDGKVNSHNLMDVPVDLRNYKRHQKKLKLVVEVGTSLATAETEDVSLGGVKFYKSIETKNKLNFVTAILSGPDGGISFKMRPIYDGPKPIFNRAEIIACSDLDQWRSLTEGR